MVTPHRLNDERKVTSGDIGVIVVHGTHRGRGGGILLTYESHPLLL